MATECDYLGCENEAEWISKERFCLCVEHKEIEIKDGATEDDFEEI